MATISFKFQSTRPSRGATRAGPSAGRITQISIHAPLAGRDSAVPLSFMAFLISIHAPLAGRDRHCLFVLTPSLYFNPRAPRGARLR